jgi:hypothetical protein
MLAGIAVQLAAIIVYLTIALEFFIRWSLDRPIHHHDSQNIKAAEAGRLNVTSGTGNGMNPALSPDSERTAVQMDETDGLDQRAKTMIFGLGFSTICLLIRSIYRVVELSDGWGGKIITNEHYFSKFHLRYMKDLRPIEFQMYSTVRCLSWQCSV